MQGFNMGRYHAPSSLDSSLDSSLVNRPTPSARSSKKPAGAGPPTIRFEMPFAIWCTTCSPESIIAQGVRFNATKTRVGNYYTTPIWAFRMRHGACGGTIEIRTDPQQGEYEVTEGGRRRDYGIQKVEEGVFGEILTEEERERRRGDAFANLEGTLTTKEKAKREADRVKKLKEIRERDWADPWSANKRLRKGFRVERKDRQAKEKEREEIADRLALGIEVLDESQEDKDKAALVTFGESADAAIKGLLTSTKRPLFKGRNESLESNTKKTPQSTRKTKAQIKSEQSRALLKGQIQGNTRASVDPFLTKPGTHRTPTVQLLTGLKRKKPDDSLAVDEAQSKEDIRSSSNDKHPSALVEYESDD